MAAAKNADEYAAARVGSFFTGSSNGTMADGDITGQCVPLVKWYGKDMADLPNPGKARGNAKDFGDTLVREGLAVPVTNPIRGDLVVWKNMATPYGHIGVVLSGGRVFEENIGVAGVPVRTVNGAKVYGARIGALTDSFRKGPPSFYRLNNYKEVDVVTKEDTPLVRIIMSEVEGWDGNDIHTGKDDAQIMGAWVGKSWQEFIWHCWNVQATHRQNLVDTVAAQSKAITELQKKLTEAQASTGTFTDADRTTLQETKSLVEGLAKTTNETKETT